MQKKRITFYVMRSLRQTDTDLVDRLNCKGVGDILLNLAKYYVYVVADTEHLQHLGRLDSIYTGTVGVHNKNVYRLKVNYTAVDIEVFNKLATLWEADSISKVANYLLYLAIDLDYLQYQNYLQQLNSTVPNYNSWLYTQPLLLTDAEDIAAVYTATQQLLQQQAQLKVEGVDSSTSNSLLLSATVQAHTKLLVLGAKVYNKRGDKV